MHIKSISPRKKFLSAVYTDGREEPFILDSTVLCQEGIIAGTEISDEEIVRLSRLSENRRAKERALRLMEFRDHSKAELRKKLSVEYDDQAVDYALNKMSELGLTDDTAYAKKYLRTLLEVKKYSKTRAAAELCRRGISREITEYVLSEADVNPKEQIKDIIEKKYYPLPSDEKGIRRMINYLLRQGYSYGEIKSVLKDYEDLV